MTQHQSNQNTSMVQKPAASGALSGNVSDGARANALLREASEKWHLVSPATRCGDLPEGTSISLSTVQVSIEHESYDVGAGKRALSKSALDRIAGASGVSWLAGESGRLDNGADPRYVNYVAVGTVRQFDGSLIKIQGEKEMDLRDGSPQVEILIAKARAKGRDHVSQLRELRSHILSHAATKARLRAVRSLGVRSSYSPQELAKPFVVAKLFFSGATNDPVLRRQFAVMRASSMIDGARSLFGAPAAEKLALESRILSPPPALGAHAIDDDDFLPEEPPPAQEAPPPAEAADVAPPPAQAGAAPPTGESGFVVPGGQEKDFPIESASTATVKWWLNTITKNISEGRSRSPERELAWCDAARKELARRESRD